MTKIRNIFKSKPKSDENLSKSKPTFAVFRIKSKPTSRKTVSNPKQGAKRKTFNTRQTTHSIQLSGVMTAVSLTSYALRNDDGN